MTLGFVVRLQLCVCVLNSGPSVILLFLLCRCFALEEDHEFVYLALEKCKTTLSEALQVCIVSWALSLLSHCDVRRYHIY